MAGRKRAPGGGRKPIGPSAARVQLSVRMPDDLRAELEAAAATRGHSLTQEMLGRLRESLARERIDRQDEPMRALCFLFQELAERLHFRQGRIRGRKWAWHRDPFVFRAFKLGVAKLLDALEPPGEVRSPYAHATREPGDNIVLKQMTEWFKTPESAATHTAASVLEGLFRPRRVTAEDETMIQVIQQKLKSTDWPTLAKDFVGEWKREYFAMSKAGLVLGVNQSPLLGKFQKEPTK